MKIKTKLTMGVGLLLALILLLAVIGITQIMSLANASEQVLVANYNSLDYSRNMLKILDEIPVERNALEKFEHHLAEQEKNITEAGENEMTESLRSHFNQLTASPQDSFLLKRIREDLNGIMKINLDAISRKSKIAGQAADQAILWIPATGALCFMIAFILLFNLPGNIANPIRELTDSIKQIASKKYSERVHFEGHNEFGELAQSFNTMAQKLEEYNDSNLAKIMIEKKRIEMLINNMHDPVIGLDENRKVIFVNEEALKIFGAKEPEILGRAAQDIAVTNDLMRLLIKDLITGEQGSGDQVPIKIYANGKESFFEKEIIQIRITPTGESTKIDIGDVIILRNVTSYKELDVAKTNFIATLSHEFKTPIAAIRMSVDLLKKQELGTVTAEQKELLESIEDDANRLLKITGEILNLSQVETGNIQLAIEVTDPKAIVTNAVRMNKVMADQKNIKLEFAFPQVLSLIKADEDKTTWVLSNLIGNAIRYSYDQSAVLLSIEEEKEFMRFSVKDTGQGIAPQFIGKVFDRYFRIPGTKKEGTGLGLSISKELIEAQGGHIFVESEYGAGSTFSFTLPLHSVQET
jgi:two-component system, NtrC family, sensor histidine kinase KinB